MSKNSNRFKQVAFEAFNSRKYHVRISEQTRNSISNRSNEVFLAGAMNLYDQLSPKDRQQLGSMSSTLHFVNVLAVESTGCTKCLYNVGFTLRTDATIRVPVILPGLDFKTGIKEKDIRYRTVLAGETFHVTRYELMVLICEPQYSGYCMAFRTLAGFYITVSSLDLLLGRAELPLPSFRLRQGLGSLKDHASVVTQQDEHGMLYMKPGYERFTSFIPKTMRSHRTIPGFEHVMLS